MEGQHHPPLKIQTKLLDTLLDLVHGERTGEVINRGLMRNITKMLMDLGPSIYQEDFERPFLEVSASFYSGESQQFIESCDCAEYLQRAEKRLNEEIERVTHYLDVKTELKITSVVEKEMIANRILTLVHMENSGLVSMLLDDKCDDLSTMYNLFRRVPDGLSTIRDVMTSHLRETGTQLVVDQERLKDPVGFVQRLLDEKGKYDKIIISAFNNYKTFQNALNSSFEYFIKLNNRSPEFISLYVDDKLLKGLKGVSEEDIEIITAVLDLLLFCHVEQAVGGLTLLLINYPMLILSENVAASLKHVASSNILERPVCQFPGALCSFMQRPSSSTLKSVSH